MILKLTTPKLSFTSSVYMEVSQIHLLFLHTMTNYTKQLFMSYRDILT